MTAKHAPRVGSPEADAQTVFDNVVKGTLIDPQLGKRVRERAKAIREKILATHGVQDIGVELIRELRGELNV